MSKKEFEQSDFADKNGLYSMVQRDTDGNLSRHPIFTDIQTRN